MKLLNKNTDYAIRALLALAQSPDDFVSGRMIAASQSIPYAYLRRILQQLIHSGIVASKEGAGGGVRILKSADSIRVKDLIEIFQGRLQLSECMFRKKVCPNRATCALRHEVLAIEKKVNEEFGKLTLGKLLRKMRSGS